MLGAYRRLLAQSRFARLLAYVTPHRRVLLLAVVLMIGESAIALANPWIAGRFAELVLHPPASPHVGVPGLMILWVTLLAAQSALSFGNRYLLGSTGETMLANLRTRLYDHLQSLPLGYFHERRRGEVLALLGNDAAHISSFVTGTLVSLLPLLITFAGAFYFLFLISPTIAILAGALVPLFFLVMKLIGRRLRPLSSEWVRTHAEMFSTLEENIGMLPAIKSFTREAHESDRFQRSNAKLMRIAKRQLLIESILSPSIHLLAGTGLLLLLYLGTLQLQSGALQPSDMVSILLYGMLLTRPISGLAGVYGSVQTARGAATRLLEAFGVRPEPDDAGAPPLPPITGAIRLEDVHFGYPGRAKVLDGAELEIRAKETVALTGENGAGKSTIVHLLMRFADPDRGRVLIDGTDIRGVGIASLRSQIGLVAQHVLLLNGTLRENIAYGRPDATAEEIESAARSAQAHGFIQHLPHGYDTLIGDQGIRLSGGQRQRISLARALLKDPPILILDEATAMFDPDGELAFIHDCRSVLEQRTVILITHRPASLALANRVLLVAQGQVCERPRATPYPAIWTKP
ncbi:ABC transporter ATP-binding protein [Thiocapsa sp.]|uniref:ABC transporter ATP-binding protein n=1 Tax=Thiocapsa sp. TaxID=2024551 RepID=UPI002BBC7E5B|nr:ABC transporter ATP-binding protein [Thiocapsa sp.]HSO81703.1 ABC transporter ATP-binding protein [Thiocapsa sp.]